MHGLGEHPDEPKRTGSIYVSAYPCTILPLPAASWQFYGSTHPHGDARVQKTTGHLYVSFLVSFIERVSGTNSLCMSTWRRKNA